MDATRKYKLLKDDSIPVYGDTLFRIEALKDFKDVLRGDLGGYVRSEVNLCHRGNCWVGGKAKVFGDAKIYSEAKVSGKALVDGNAKVFGTARVRENAEVSGDAMIFGDAQVYGKAQVYGNAWISGNAQVYRDAWVYRDVWKTSPVFIQGSRHSLMTSSYTTLKIGSLDKALSDWQEDFKKIEEFKDYTESQVEEYEAYIELIIKLMAKRGYREIHTN